MQRRMSHRTPGGLFIVAVAIALSLVGWSTAVANEIVIAVWTSPEAEKSAKRAKPSKSTNDRFAKAWRV